MSISITFLALVVVVLITALLMKIDTQSRAITQLRFDVELCEQARRKRQ